MTPEVILDNSSGGRFRLEGRVEPSCDLSSLSSPLLTQVACALTGHKMAQVGASRWSTGDLATFA
jgi:hypothetical protein